MSIKNALQSDMSIIGDFIANSNLQTHPLINNFFEYSMLASRPLFLESLSNLGENTVNYESRISCDESIPMILHRVWVTDLTCTQDPPEYYLNNLIIKSKNYCQNFSNIFWVRSRDKQKSLVEKLDKSKIFEIREISELGYSSQYSLVDKLLEQRKFAFACDIIRMICLNQFGGIYADLGLTFNCNIDDLVENTEYLLLLWKNLFFQNSLMGFRPHDIVTATYLNYISNPKIIPPHLYQPLSAISEGYVFAGPFLTWIFANVVTNKHNVSIVAPNGELINWMAQQSWYTLDGDSGKLGNAYIPNTSPSFL